MIYSLDLDITPNGVPQIVKLSQYDKTMPTLAIKLYNGSQVFTIPTGCTAYIEGTKADKTGFQYPCTVSGGVINATITEQMTAFAGRVPCEIVLRKSGERKGSANFFLDIEPSALSDDTVISDSDLPIIQQMPEYAQSCADDAELAHKWATFGSDSETPSATNNAKYWAEQAEAVTGVGDLMTTRSKLGAKNLLPLTVENLKANNTGGTWSGNTYTYNGITFEVMTDTYNNITGIKVSGTASSTAALWLGIIELPNGSYIANGVPSGASVAGFSSLYQVYNGSTYSDKYCLGSVTFNVTNNKVKPFVCRVAQGTTISTPIIYYPMIRLATDHDSTYQPYAMTNRELTENIAPLLFNNAGAHNAIYRGKNLGTSVTDEQWAVITAGTFDDLYIGDYWVINGKTWRIAAFDYFLHSGDTECTTHHAVIVPDGCLYNAQMNTTNDTTGGYVAVKTRGVLTDAETAIKAAFGTSHILSHRVYLTNAVAKGKPSGGAWVDTICDLMNEEMVYGTGILRPTSDGSTTPTNYRVEKSQLPLFAHEPSRIINRMNYWLRDIVTATGFALVGNYGYAVYSGASGSLGVRPAFCIS